MNGGCFLPLIFGITGGFFGGPLGAFSGIILGYFISRISVKKYARRRAKKMDSSVLESITKLSLVVMKADAGVMRSELYLFRDFMIQNFGSDIASEAIELLQKFKDCTLTVDAAAGDINAKLNYNERMQVLQFLFQLAGADSQINTNELSVLSQISQRLHIRQYDFTRLRISYETFYYYQNFQSGGYHNQQESSSANVRNSSPQESDYAILGVKSSDSNETIKTAYRRLAVANHPDKVEHLGEVARANAEKRFSEINQAYDRIKKVRKL
jgi:DnaJ like chaperone protein